MRATAESRSEAMDPRAGTNEGRTGEERQAGLDAGPVLADGIPPCGYSFDGLACDEVGRHWCAPRSAHRLWLDTELAACREQATATRLWGAHLWADPEVRWVDHLAAYLPVQTEVGGEVKPPRIKQRPRSKPKPPPAERTVEVDDGEAVVITITVERKRK